MCIPPMETSFGHWNTSLLSQDENPIIGRIFAGNPNIRFFRCLPNRDIISSLNPPNSHNQNCWRTTRETPRYFRYHSFIYIWTKLYRLRNHSFHFLFSSVLYCETEVHTHHTFLSYFILIPSHVPSIC